MGRKSRRREEENPTRRRRPINSYIIHSARYENLEYGLLRITFLHNVLRRSYGAARLKPNLEMNEEQN